MTPSLRPLLSSLLLTLLGAAACGPAAERDLTLSGPAALTVFRDLEVELPLTLQWDGDPEPVTLSGGSSTGLTVVSQQVLAGSTQVVVRVVASEDASSGEVTVTAEGEGVAATFIVPVQVAAATLAAPPAAPVLRGGYAVVEVRVEGGEPTFEGAERVEALGEGLWRLRLSIPQDAPAGAQERPLTVRVAEVSAPLAIPVTVTHTAVVTVIDRTGTVVQGVEVAINQGTFQVTDAAGRVSVADVVAPYRLDVRRTGTSDTYEAVRRASPTALVSIFSEPMRSKTVQVTMRDASTGALFTSGVKSVQFNFSNVHGWSFGIPQDSATKEDTVRWYSQRTSVNGRVRAAVSVGGAIVGLAEELVSLDSTDVDPSPMTLRVEPAAFGTIHTRIRAPEGFSLGGRWATAVFAGNRFDRLGLGGTESANVEAAIPEVLLRDDVRHDVQVYASDLAGRFLVGNWQGLQAGDTVEADLTAPPLLPLPATLNDAHSYRFEGPSWPVYRLTLTVGSSGSQQTENVYSASPVLTRSGVLSFPASAPAGVNVCGYDHVSEVDGLLDGDIWQKPGVGGCDAHQEVTWQNP